VIPANSFEEYTWQLDKRVGSFPESKELYEQLYAMARQPENAKSIIVCTQRYNIYKIPDDLGALFGKMYLFEPRGPYSQDHPSRVAFEAYLKTLGLNLLPCYIPNRLAAAKAGLGKFGRNNFIYDSRHGSYVWIDAWVVDRELVYDAIEEELSLPACNDGCNKCVEACPTKAMTGEFSMDRGRCVAHLGWNAKDLPDEETRAQMGLWMYGCDACQDACPLNQDKFTATDDLPLLAEYEKYLTLERLLEMDEDTYIEHIQPRFWFIGKDGLWLWKCNALRSMINSGESKYHGLIKQFCGHEDSWVREMAQWGCRMLGLSV
jgi:epoxyqueuosine reductase